jgi:apolipoprotein N-acyltransferase
VELKWYIAVPLALCSALMLLFSYPPYNLNFLAFFALAPILFVTYHSNLKRTLGYGILFAFIFYCLYLFWMNAYMAVVGVGFVTVVFGGCFVIGLLIINLAARAFPRFTVILTPFIWIGVDYLRSFGFLGFTFGSIGYTQHNFLPFIQIADIGGEQLIAFILVLFNAGAAALIPELLGREPFRMKNVSPYHRVPLYVSVGLIVLSLVYGTFRLRETIPDGRRMKLSMIQGLSSPRTTWKEEKWETLRTLTSLTRESYWEADDLDLIVWTETAIRTSLRPNLIYGTSYHARIRRLVQEAEKHFIIGSPDNYHLGEDQLSEEKLDEIYPTRDDTEVWTNSAYYLNPQGDIVGKYDKIQLTPFGEHFPLGEKIPFLGNILKNFTDSAGFTAGSEYSVFDYGDMRFGVVICWEGTYGYMIRRFINNGADFILNISNDMWTQTEAGHFQHFTISKFRAIENRIWFARAANDGVTAIVDPYGRVVSILPIKEVGYLIGEVGPRLRTTFYTRFGNILPIIGLVVLTVTLFASIVFVLKKQAADAPE